MIEIADAIRRNLKQVMYKNIITNERTNEGRKEGKEKVGINEKEMRKRREKGREEGKRREGKGKTEEH